jgi:Ser/Thr protein kinase RdoA (MazF antagonist)
MMEGASVTDVPRAIAAARSTVSALGLSVEDAIVLHASNRLAIRLLPSDVLARVATRAHRAAQLEVDLATRLAASGSPVADLDPRVAPRVYERDEFVITIWTYYEGRPSSELSADDYAEALWRLHKSLRGVDVPAPHFMDRVVEAESIISSRDRSPELTDADRDLLKDTFTTVSQAIIARPAKEQLLHGEPHPGNLLNTEIGPLFVDLETCCRGPIEFDVAHAPAEVGRRYQHLDHGLLDHCRLLVLAMITAWRVDTADRFPNGKQTASDLLGALRAGPPYPALGTMRGLH